MIFFFFTNVLHFLKNHYVCSVSNEWEVFKTGAEILGKNCLPQEEGERMKREEEMQVWSFEASLLERNIVKLGDHVNYPFEIMLIQLKENLSGQFVIFTSDNQLLRCSHRGDRWLDLS